jgi:hypothetical protein
VPDIQSFDVNYDDKQKIFFVRLDGTMFIVPSPYQKLDGHFLNRLSATSALLSAIAKDLQTGRETSARALLLGDSVLAENIMDAIGRCMDSYVRGKFRNFELGNGNQASVRCLTCQPPTFEFLSSNLTATVSFYEVQKIRVTNASLSDSKDEALPFANAIIAANALGIFQACVKLWADDLGLPKKAIVAG